MCSGLSMTSFDLLEALETKLSCSAMAGSVAVVSPGGTGPGSDDDLGNPPDDTKDPIGYPPTKPSGPPGPGAHSLHV